MCYAAAASVSKTRFDSYEITNEVTITTDGHSWADTNVLTLSVHTESGRHSRNLRGAGPALSPPINIYDMVMRLYGRTYRKRPKCHLRIDVKTLRLSHDVQASE